MIFPAHDLAAVCAGDGEFLLAARRWTGGLRLVAGAELTGVTVKDGMPVPGVPQRGDGVIELDGPGEVWASMLLEVPPPFLNDVSPAVALGHIERHADELLWWQYVPAVQRAVELLRANGASTNALTVPASRPVGKFDVPVASTATIERPNRQQERFERSTNALLNAAAELIVEGGFASLTFAAIGERAGYSRGLVTSRFGSKEGLVEGLIERIVNTWNHRKVLPLTEGKPGLAGVDVLLDAVRRQAETDLRGLRVLYALMFEALGPDESLRTRFAKFHETMRADFAQLISNGQHDGSIRPGIDPASEAALIVGSLRGIGYQWLLDPDHFDPVQALAYLHDTTTERLAAR